MTTVTAAVAERRLEWMRVVNDGDLEGYADLVTDDVVWLPPAGAPLTSRQAFRAWLEPFFTRYAYKFPVDPRELRDFDGWCAEAGRFRSVLSTGSGNPQEHTGPTPAEGTQGAWGATPHPWPVHTCGRPHDVSGLSRGP